LDRREFLKISAASAGIFIGFPGMTGQIPAARAATWKPASFPRVLLYNFLLFDNTRHLKDDRIIIIEKDRIRAVEARGDLTRFIDYKKVDLKGRTLLPGFIDNHVHITVPFMYDVNWRMFVQMNDQIELNFYNCVMGGVTTVRDVGGFPEKILKYKCLSDDNKIPGPRVISSLSPIAARQGDRLGAPEKAPYFTNPVTKWFLGGNYAERPTNLREIEAACDSMIEKGAQWLKTLHQDHSYSYYPRKLPNHTDEGYRLIIRKGRQNGIKCALHEPLISGFKKGVDLGFDTLEHMPQDGIIPDRDIDRFIRKKMAILPTALVYGDDLRYDRLLKHIKTRGEDLLMPEASRQMSARLSESVALQKRPLSENQRRKMTSDPEYIRDKFPNILANISKMHQMGATVGIGSDIGGSYAAFFGRYVDELRHFSEAGISNFDILNMATAVNAEIIDMQDRIGTIEKGKQADIIAVWGNPLEDLNVCDRVSLVMKGGVFLKAEGINL
jgi:imidazolonepropionase-like amidohydrolase